MNKEIRYFSLSLASTYSLYNHPFHGTAVLISAEARSMFDEFNVKGGGSSTLNSGTLDPDSYRLLEENSTLRYPLNCSQAPNVSFVKYKAFQRCNLQNGEATFSQPASSPAASVSFLHYTESL